MTCVTPITVPFFGTCLGIVTAAPIEQVRELLDRFAPDPASPLESSSFDLDLRRWWPWSWEPIPAPSDPGTRE